jgi:hypothetical protein
VRKRFALGKFDESKHERDEGGRFASKGGGSAPSIRQRQLVERSPGRLFEEKWGRRGGAFNAAREAPVGNGHDTRFVAWQKVGPKNPNLPPEYTGSTEREVPVDGYTSIGMAWQRPKQLSRREDEAVRAGLTAAIRDQRDAAIERATERGLIPDGTDRKALSRAYNLAAMRALHEFGIGSLDYRMSDDLKAEMMPLTPAMRFFQRRLADQMRSRPDTKGKWQPYHEEFKVPYDDMRLDRRPGKGNQLRLKWPKSMGSHTDFIKAHLPGEMAKAAFSPKGGKWGGYLVSYNWGATKPPLTPAQRRAAKKAVEAEWDKRADNIGRRLAALAPRKAEPKVRKYPAGASGYPGPRQDADGTWSVRVSKAHLPGALAKVYDESKHERDESGRWKSAAGAVVATGVAVRATRAGAERVLGAQRFVHGTSRSAVNSILKTGLDPNRGGSASGGTHAMFGEGMAATHKGQVYVARDNFLGRRLAAAPHAALSQLADDVQAGRRFDPPSGTKTLTYFSAMVGPGSPRSNRVGGAMPYEKFKAKFSRDPKMPAASQAFMAHEAVGPENLRRSRAGLAQIVRGRSKNIPRYIKANKGRAALGAALLGVGAAAANQARVYAQDVLGKADAAAVGAATTLSLADKIIAARKAKRAGTAGPRPGTAPPEVMAVLPEMRRVLHEGAARRGMMAAAPQQQRHHGNHTVIRDPRRSLTELLR